MKFLLNVYADPAVTVALPQAEQDAMLDQAPSWRWRGNQVN
jgi:hypothetical protein